MNELKRSKSPTSEDGGEQELVSPSRVSCWVASDAFTSITQVNASFDYNRSI